MVVVVAAVVVVVVVVVVVSDRSFVGSTSSVIRSGLVHPRLVNGRETIAGEILLLFIPVVDYYGFLVEKMNPFF